MRHSQHRLLKLRVLPTPAAVGGYLDPTTSAAAGPSQAGYLVKTGAGQPLSKRRAEDHRFRLHLEMEPALLALQIGLQIRVRADFHFGHVGFVYHLDLPEPLHTEGSVPARD